MKKLPILLILVACPLSAFGGQDSGAGPKAIVTEFATNMVLMDIQKLPKGYANTDDFRLAKIRLSEKNVQSVPLTLETGESVKVHKIRDSIVDDAFSQEILPK